MVCHSNKGLFNKNPSFGYFLGDLPESCGLWGESTVLPITWFKEKKTESIVSISAELSLEVLHGLFAPWSQKFPEGKPSCNDKRLGWDSPD